MICKCKYLPIANCNWHYTARKIELIIDKYKIDVGPDK